MLLVIVLWTLTQNSMAAQLGNTLDNYLLQHMCGSRRHSGLQALPCIALQMALLGYTLAHNRFITKVDSI